MLFHAALILCAIGAGALVYRYNRYNPEPLAVLFLAVALGWGAGSLLNRVELETYDRIERPGPGTISAIAAVEEETAKLLIAVAVSVFARRRFRDPMDGIIYGSMAGIGMAVEESFAYLSQLPPGNLFLPPSEIVRLFLHLVLGGISAFAIGPVVFGGIRRAWLLPVCWASAIALHFSWDWISLGSIGPVPSVLQAWNGAALVLIAILSYGALISKAAEQSRRIFSPASPVGLWGWPFNRSKNGGPVS